MLLFFHSTSMPTTTTTPSEEHHDTITHREPDEHDDEVHTNILRFIFQNKKHFTTVDGTHASYQCQIEAEDCSRLQLSMRAAYDDTHLLFASIADSKKKVTQMCVLGVLHKKMFVMVLLTLKTKFLNSCVLCSTKCIFD